MDLLIGLTGHKQVGKDTIADYLSRAYGFQKFAFAGSLKNAAKEIFGFTDDQLNGDKKEIVDDYWQVTPREILQVMGSELFRETLPQHIPAIGKNVWSRGLERKIINARQETPGAHHYFVIADVRFPNESEIIRKLGGIIIRVERANISAGVGALHMSETSMDNEPCDFVIRNNGTFDDLYGIIEFLIKSIRAHNHK